MMEDVIARINELAKKAKAGGPDPRQNALNGTGCGGFIWTPSGKI